MIWARAVVFSCLLTLAGGAFADDEAPPLDIAFLESLTPRDGTVYLRPSEVHDDYRVVIYVNVSETTAAGQKMWLLERDNPDDAWRLGLWDQDYWAERDVTADQTPPFSWIVSTGRRYADTVRSGPTPIGFFNMDDRSWRHSKGWVRHDIVDIMYIDLHYSSGRASGVAFHGTPESEYKYLGQAESHGCVRMNQPNARALYDYIHRFDALSKDDNPLWGKLPRYYRSTSGKGVRQSYRRDGKLLTDGAGNILKKNGYRVGLMFFTDDRRGNWPEELALRPKQKPDLDIAAVAE